MENLLSFPIPPVIDNTIRLFPAAEPDPNELNLYVPDDTVCCHCSKPKTEMPPENVIVLAGLATGEFQIYCNTNCLALKVMSFVKASASAATVEDV